MAITVGNLIRRSWVQTPFLWKHFIELDAKFWEKKNEISSFILEPFWKFPHTTLHEQYCSGVQFLGHTSQIFWCVVLEMILFSDTGAGPNMTAILVQHFICRRFIAIFTLSRNKLQTTENRVKINRQHFPTNEIHIDWLWYKIQKFSICY